MTLAAGVWSDAAYIEPGELLLVQNGNLMAHPFDSETGKLAGQPRLVAEGVAFTQDRHAGRYSASADGTVVYQAAYESRLEWFDFEGRSLGTLGEPGRIVQAEPSPDGRRVALLTSRPDGRREGWIVDARTGLRAPQSELDVANNLVWSPDGRSILMGSLGGMNISLRVVSLDGSTKPRELGQGWPFAWSRDGAWILYGLQKPDTAIDVYVVAAEGGGEPRPVAATRASEYGAAFSPDGRWALIVSDQSGRFEVCVAPIGRAGAVRPVTAVGVTSAAQWTDDGRIVYRSAGELWEVEARAEGEEIEFGEPRRVFGGRKVPASEDPAAMIPISIARDGKRLLAIVPAAGEGEPPLVLVQHALARDSDR